LDLFRHFYWSIIIGMIHHFHFSCSTCGLYFYSLKSAFLRAEVLIMIMSNLSFCSFIDHAFVIICKKIFYPIFHSRSFIVLSFRFGSVTIELNWYQVWSVILFVYLFIYLFIYLFFAFGYQAIIVGNTMYPPLNCLCTFVKINCPYI